MTPTQSLSPSLAGSAVCCAVAAYGTVRASAPVLAAWRQKLEAPVGEPLSASVLKHVDEQTLVVLAAAYRAIQNHGLTQTCFTDWGILAAPRFLGRTALAHALQRYALEGAWGISPHVIPHRTLHSVSGTVSQALRIHGPNFGIDGGPSGAGQALLAAGALLSDPRLPGLWLFLSGWDHEPIHDPSAANGQHQAEAPLCCAVALALTRAVPGWTGLRLRVCPGTVHWPGDRAQDGQTPPRCHLESLLATLENQGADPSGVWSTNGGGRVELQWAIPGGENEP